MKSLIIKFLFKNVPPKPFFGVRILNGRMEEKVFLKNGTRALEVSNRHNIVCENPFCIAVWVNEDQLVSFNTEELKLEILKGTELVASLHIKRIKKLEQNNGAIFIFEVVKARCRQLNRLRQYILITFFSSNRRHTYKESQIYGALYSYPRKVIVTSFRNNEYYNIFPQDFQGEYPEIDIYLLGLKVSNITVNRIIETKRVVVSSTETIDTRTIYGLGAHHSKTPPRIEDLSFKVQDSELLKFPVPAFSSSYKEIEITDHIKLGSHIMLVGRILNSIQVKENHFSLYHVHFFEYVHSRYEEA